MTPVTVTLPEDAAEVLVTLPEALVTLPEDAAEGLATLPQADVGVLVTPLPRTAVPMTTMMMLMSMVVGLVVLPRGDMPAAVTVVAPPLLRSGTRRRVVPTVVPLSGRMLP